MLKRTILYFSLSLLLTIQTYSQYAWNEQVSGVTTQLTSVSAVDFNFVWVCGYAGVVLRTTNGGSNWQNAATSTIPPTLDMHCIWGIDANTALVGGSGSSSFLFRTSNGGANWTQVFTETGGFINSVQMGNIFAGYMQGDPVGGRWSLWGTTNAGITWDSSTFYLPQVAAEAGWNNSFYFDINTGVLFGTNNTRVYKTLNLISWTPQVTTGQLNSYAIWFRSPLEGMTGGTALLATTNGGVTWLPTTMALPGTGNLAGITTHANLWIVTRQTQNIYIGTDMGNNWSSVYTAPAGNYRHISKVRNGPHIYGVRTNGGITRGQFITGITPVSTEIPSTYSLNQNYPNPFNPETNIKFNLPKEGFVKLTIYDGVGREVESLVNENLKAGEYEVSFNAVSLPSGAYFYKLVVNDFIQTKKMILVK